jgi:hypothetical protein
MAAPHHHPDGIARWRPLVRFLAGGGKGPWARKLARQRAATRWNAACEGTSASTEALALWLAAPPATAATLLKAERFKAALLHGVLFHGPLAHATGELDGWWDSQTEDAQVEKVLHVRRTYPTLEPLCWLAARAAWTYPHQAPATLWDRLCADTTPPLDTATWLVANAQDDVAIKALAVVVGACPQQPGGWRDGSVLDNPDILFGSPRLWCALEASGVRTSEDALVRIAAALMGSPWHKAGLFGTNAHAALRRQAFLRSRSPEDWVEAFGPEESGAVGADQALHEKMSRMLLDGRPQTSHIKGMIPLAEAALCAP